MFLKSRFSAKPVYSKSSVSCTTMNDTSSNVRKGPNKLTSWGLTKNFQDMNSTLKPYQGRSALANWCNGAGGGLLLGTPGLRPMRGPRSPSRTRRSLAWEWALGHRMRSLSGWWSSFCHHPLPLPWIGQSRQKCQMPSSNAGLDLIKRLKCIQRTFQTASLKKLSPLLLMKNFQSFEMIY